MAGSELGMSMVGLIWMFIFWGGLILLALWLVSLLFPAAPHLDSLKKSNSGEKRLNSNDKTKL